MNLYLFEYTGQYCYGGAAVIANTLQYARGMLFDYIQKTHQRTDGLMTFNDLEQMVLVETFSQPSDAKYRVVWSNYECC